VDRRGDAVLPHGKSEDAAGISYGIDNLPDVIHVSVTALAEVVKAAVVPNHEVGACTRTAVVAQHVTHIVDGCAFRSTKASHRQERSAPVGLDQEAVG